jgi:shikimate kinase
MRNQAIAYGAITVINAISIGKGAALGIDLQTQASIISNDHPGTIKVEIKPDRNENPRLARLVVGKVLQTFRLEDRFGAEVEVDSNIPIARGLKSSSAAANAIALATLGALGKRIHDLEVVKLGVTSAIEAGVTITGAFDDACASYFGDLVVTDNRKLKVERKFEIRSRYKVLVHVPESKSYTISSNLDRMKDIAPLIRIAYKEALKGNYWNALCFNGYAHSVALGYDPSIAMEALSAGAVAAGLSGKGPAVAAIVPSNKVDSVKRAWTGYPGKVVMASINSKKAHMLG